MPGLAPGAAVATVSDAGRIKGNLGGTGAGSAGAPAMLFNICGTSGVWATRRLASIWVRSPGLPLRLTTGLPWAGPHGNPGPAFLPVICGEKRPGDW